MCKMRWFWTFKSVFLNTVYRKCSKYEYSIYRNYCKSLESRQDIRDNPYFEKYAGKISEAQKITPDNFKARLEKNLKALHNIIDSPKVIPTDPTEFDRHPASFTQKQRQNDLNQIMKIDAVQEKTAAEIESIWKQYHQIKDGVYAVLPTSAYKQMYSNFSKYPIFLFPLPRVQGYEFILCQFSDRSCYFTSLLNYQAYQENAPVCFTVTYFTEFLNTKGIVLMRGEYDDAVLGAHEAQCLANQLQLFYGGGDEAKLRLLQLFHSRPASFRHADLVAEFESGLGR